MSSPTERHDLRVRAAELGAERQPLTRQLRMAGADDPGIYEAWQAAWDDAAIRSRKPVEEAEEQAAPAERGTREPREQAPARGRRPRARSLRPRVKAAASSAGRAAQAASAAYQGRGSWTGVAVAMLGLVLLYLLLVHPAIMSSVVAGIRNFLVSFTSPYHPLT